jgi:N-carbamoylputrescine amidase
MAQNDRHRSSTVRIGLVQMAMSDDPEANTEKAVALTREAAQTGAEVICLPELFRSRYFCKTTDHGFFELAEPIPGPSTERFGALAQELGVDIVASLFERRARGLYHNTAAVLDAKDGYVGKYRKMHIPDDPLFHEKFYFTPGDLGFKNFETTHGNLGVLICWDQWYPEAARLTALRGAEILFYPTAIGWLASERDTFGRQQHEAWERCVSSHAVTNGCFVVAVNRTGFEPAPEGSPDSGIQFWGQSFVAAPSGQILHRMGVDEEGTAVVECDLGHVEGHRTHWPFLRDRRVDHYQRLTARLLDEE